MPVFDLFSAESRMAALEATSTIGRRIIESLSEKERSATKLSSELEIPLPTVLYHLSRLEMLGIARSRRGLGKRLKEVRIYSLAEGRILFEAKGGKKMSDEKGVENVGVLDLRSATREDIERMGAIENVGMILVSEDLKGFVSSKIRENVGLVVSPKENERIFVGDTKINREMLEALEEPIEFLQAGRLTMEGDVTKELIKEKIRSFRSYGLLVAPKELQGILMAKCIENAGKIVTPEEAEESKKEL